VFWPCPSVNIPFEIRSPYNVGIREAQEANIYDIRAAKISLCGKKIKFFNLFWFLVIIL
jgi:hypothetical protein